MYGKFLDVDIKTSSTAVFILRFNICLHVMTANSAEIAHFHLVTRKKCLVILCQIFKGEG